MKTIEETFGLNSSLSKYKIQELKFSKKNNSALVYLNINEKISLRDVKDTEALLCSKFSLNSLKIVPVLNSNVFEIEEKDILDAAEYLKSYKPYISMYMSDIKIKIEESDIEIILNYPAETFLKLQKIDEYTEEIIYKFYGKKIKVVFKDSKDAKNNVKIPDKKIVSKEQPKTALESKSEAPTHTLNDVTKKVDANSDPKEETIYGRPINNKENNKIEDITADSGDIVLEGRIELIDSKETKTGKEIYTIDVSDKTSTISCKMFLDPKRNDVQGIKDKLKEGCFVRVAGKAEYDMYAKEVTVMIRSIEKGQKWQKRTDDYPTKRVELHMHTQMSSMDGVSSVKDLVKQAISFGHKAVAITDHGVLQSFPDANQVAYNEAEDKFNIKVLYGVEGYLVPDCRPQISGEDTYVVFDIETTGLSAVSDGITEIGAVKIKDGQVIDRFSTFVNPERNIPRQVEELTHITKDMVKDAPKIEEALHDFLEFSKDSVVIAHNARFDISFINFFCDKYEYVRPNKIIDTLAISRELFEGYENHKLGTIAKNLEVSLEDAHRAVNDAEATAKVFLKMCEILKEKNIDVNNYIQEDFIEDKKNVSPYHIIIIAKNYVGLKNLYKLVSFSHIRYFYKKPRLSRSVINRYREGLIVGSACERGELFQAIINNEPEEKIEEIAKFYDYLEIQPIANNHFYIENGRFESEQDLENINKKIVELGEKLNIPVVGTCDVHFMNPEDEIYRRIIMAGQGYEDADNQAPLYFRTTQEMLDEFKYLSQEKREEIVITNPNKIADMVEEIKPVVSGTYNPVIEGSDEEIEKLTYEKAKSIYGDPLPDIVQKRIEKELNSIITHGFSVMYIIAEKLVKKSNADGYLVGSRGSVGSSFVATMSGITEVNPLPPHYVCNNCKYSEFPNTTVTTGIDMEDKICPKCGKNLRKDGMDIPFETFLGFKGDKVPDIDLNFSGDYQAKAHAYTEELFGKYKTFRAGTISTLADKTAYGFVKKYYETKNKFVQTPEINRLAKNCTGIKRTTGQHPGGIIVVPRDKEIYDFCPVQKPADDVMTNTITTHFDFHSIHDNLLKLDILGHDDPTVIRMLEDLTGVDAKTISLDEPKVMSLFTSTEALGITEEQERSKVGTYAVPEFGTKFVRQMLVDTKPTTFGELVRISGLSHGTDVWLNNAQTLIAEGTTTLKESICTRDDIMLYLIQKGVEPSIAFKIMEITRKGKAKKLLTEEMKEEMRANNVPEWYINSCLKIKYMFPKAHACAYVMMAYRIAYFKVFYPKAFYATYYTVRADVFNADVMCQNKKIIKETIKNYESNPNSTQTEKDMITILEVVNEMLERNIKFLPIDLYKSDSVKFLVEEDGIRPPLSSIPAFGTINAKNIVKARQDGRFSSKENLSNRSKIGKVAMELLNKYGCLKGMPNSSQVSLFDEN